MKTLIVVSTSVLHFSEEGGCSAGGCSCDGFVNQKLRLGVHEKDERDLATQVEQRTETTSLLTSLCESSLSAASVKSEIYWQIAYAC